MIFCCDDVGIKYKDDLYKLENLKNKYSNFKVNVFVIAKDLDFELIKWLQQDWIEVGVHCFDHSYPPELECEDKEERIKKALSVLKPLLPDKYYYRPPGFQMMASAYKIVRDLKFNAIVHQDKIQLLNDKKNIYCNLINSHIYDNLDYNFKEAKFEFISEII